MSALSSAAGILQDYIIDVETLVWQGRDGVEVARGELIISFGYRGSTIMHWASPEPLPPERLETDLNARPVPLGDGAFLYISTERSTQEMIDVLQRTTVSRFSFGGRYIDYIEPNFIYRPLGRPDNPTIESQWAYDAIDADLAWAITRGSREIVVAVIDTGIAINHPALHESIWYNPESFSVTLPHVEGLSAPEEDTQVILGGNRPCPDGAYGFRVVGNNMGCSAGMVSPHGTWVAGVIGSYTSFKSGLQGVSPYVTILPVNAFDRNEVATTVSLVNAINLIIDLQSQFQNSGLGNIRIINASWGDSIALSRRLEQAISIAGERGILFVAGAGNRGWNLDCADLNLDKKDPDTGAWCGGALYPASYNLRNMVSVAALINSDNIWDDSNIGFQSVHLAAPGYDIWTTRPYEQSGYYIKLYGTSLAAPFVSGTAALMLAACLPDQTLSALQLRDILLETVHAVPHLQDRVSTGGRLDAGAAVAMASRICAAQRRAGEGQRSRY